MTASIERNRHVALKKLLGDRVEALPRGITSVCSAHPLVIEAALKRAASDKVVALIEATCNQVNQDGGYTGMTPGDFRRFVESIAAAVGFPANRIILGGDHLGPNPWRKLPAEEAMAKAEAMMAAYIEAGFEKIHLDTSMGCAGEPVALADELTAERAARLARVAEEAALRSGSRPPVYIIGTEVPPPGGATHALDELEITRPEAAMNTLAVHRTAFAKAGIGKILERVVAIVVQPGVEFGNANVALYRPDRAGGLVGALEQMPGMLFEAHSTDYQPTGALTALVDGGFAILKVGPGLTFAMREALYGLDAIASVLAGRALPDTLHATMEAVMLGNPAHWNSHYSGSAEEQRLQRHFSYSDRIRYYWPDDKAAAAVETLLSRFDGDIPETLISQYLGRVYPAVVAKKVLPRARDLCIAAIDAALEPYSAATIAWPASAISNTPF
ncbi:MULTISPECIES: D-tagatose-bisphosphate aldolase, class II, non-catalytic subunit [unclassified Rhizobium]|jgi:D-tagatose-bisphosphate aldolase class II non-catalytic subunit|uniref:D-tagatose-bisphosphate aldolase, class II, non-catalytic subunit n=1 Tax=unclassified Rhizobium TaxID=2613769 RepID=UPI00068E1957|nr:MULTISPECIES: D-tagatose-bisphosphate aldolase, class II, non-catalytic subunit [unclassified Rhizobium]MBN8953659.1 D-tagatose-bisphosphate aldolase, class II, non-catalytic subunit [Rhizobium tropici]OJY77538.1 MAG: D-tagatose-bisphosphate aldolase, class II, non-catalytic subunit [Rhizobium sp. 60-20]RKD56084.1 tagatose-bisphosphate aldolase noncatalytic subunit [Rhizobium sp. WW_1]